MHGHEIIFYRHVNLALNQLIITVLVPDVEQHIMKLHNELLALLLECELLLFLGIYGALAIFEALL